MVEEIDLRPYLAALIRHWKWVVGTAVLVAGVTFLLLSFQPTTYETSVLVALLTPQQIELSSLTFETTDPRFDTVNQATPPYRAFPEIATNNDLLQAVLDQLDPPLQKIETVGQLRQYLETEAGNDQTIIYLKVRMQDPEEGVRVANLWGELFVQRANTLFNRVNVGQIDVLQEELNGVLADLETAEQELITFQGQNRLLVLTNQLNNLQQLQTDYLNRQRNLELLKQDIQFLHAQINATDSFSFADQLTALSLQLKVFNAETAVPLQVQNAPSAPLTYASRVEQIAFLDALITTLDVQSVAINTQLAELEPQILATQQEKQQTETKETRLRQAYHAIQETYTALSRKLLEDQLTNQRLGESVYLVSGAVIPELPIGSGRLLKTVLAGGGGLFFALFTLFAVEWWRKTIKDLGTV